MSVDPEGACRHRENTQKGPPAQKLCRPGVMIHYYLQDRMNYELRAVRFDYRGSLSGAEYMRQVSTLIEGKRHRYSTELELVK